MMQGAVYARVRVIRVCADARVRTRARAYHNY